tara:strand:- start:18690 stop:19400 length:711 start_codon:yes stop_codon:yes gene_type:complete
MKGSGTAKLPALLVVGNSHARVAALAKRLQPVAAAAIRRVATRFNRVHANVVAGVKIHRLDDAIVAVGAIVFLVARGAEAFVVLRSVFVVGSKLKIVCSAAQASARHKLANPREVALHSIAGLGKVARRTAIASSLAIVAALARSHRRKVFGRCFLDRAKISVAVGAWGFASEMGLMAKLEIRNRQLHAFHAAWPGTVAWVAANACGRRPFYDLLRHCSIDCMACNAVGLCGKIVV